MAPATQDPSEGAWKAVVRRKKGPRTTHPAVRNSKIQLQDAPECESVSGIGNASDRPTHKESNITPEQTALQVREIETTYSRVRDSWRSSQGYKTLESAVRDKASSHAIVTQVVCLGNGPLYAPDANWDRRRTAHVQTAALFAIVDILNETAHSPIRCVFQEPYYSAADRAFLEGLGHTVVDDPAAFGMVTDTTLLWGVHMYHQVYNQALKHAAPAMFVGTKWNTWDEVPDNDGHIKDSLKRVREMHTTYDMFDFPPDESYFSFCDTCVYWKKREAYPAGASPSTNKVESLEHSTSKD